MRTGSLTGLQWAFADHAARVASKAERCKEHVRTSAADRMQALRLRIAARAKASAEGPTCRTAEVEAATTVALHGNVDTVEQQGEASIARRDLGNAGTNSWMNRRRSVDRHQSSAQPPESAG